MNYADTFFGGTKNLKNIIINEIEKVRKTKRISIKEIDSWNFNDKSCPCYSQCRKDTEKMNKYSFSWLTMGLNLGADTILFKHISKKAKKQLGKKCPNNYKIVWQSLLEI